MTAQFRFNPLATMTAADVLCFDFVTDAIRAAQLRVSPNKKVIHDLYYKDVRGFSEPQLIEGLREFFLRASKKSNIPVILAAPPSLLITKNIEIPSQDPKEIKEILNLQAGRLTPYAREEVIIDYVRIGVFRQSYVKLLLVIVNKNTVNKQLDLFHQAGIRVTKVLLPTEAMGALVQQYLKFEIQDSPFCLIHTDVATTDFNVFLKGRQIFLRSIPIGAHHLIHEKEIHLGRFIDELKKSFDAYQAEDIEASPSLTVFTGAIEEIRDLEVMMLDAFRMPVRLLSVPDFIPHSESMPKETLNSPEISMLNVAAPLLARESMSVNLVPEEVKLKLSLEERGRDIIKAGVLVMTILLFVCGIFLVNIYLKTDYLKKLNVKFKALNEEAAQIEKDFSKVRVIRNYLAGRGLSLNVLAELYELTPLEISLNNIRLREKGSFSAKGEALSMSAVFSYLKELEKSPYFREVKTKYTSKRKTGDQEVVDFELAGSLEDGPEASL